MGHSQPEEIRYHNEIKEPQGFSISPKNRASKKLIRKHKIRLQRRSSARNTMQLEGYFTSCSQKDLDQVRASSDNDNGWEETHGNQRVVPGLYLSTSEEVSNLPRVVGKSQVTTTTTVTVQRCPTCGQGGISSMGEQDHQVDQQEFLSSGELEDEIVDTEEEAQAKAAVDLWFNGYGEDDSSGDLEALLPWL